MRLIRNALYCAAAYVVALLLLYPLTATRASAQILNPPDMTALQQTVQASAAQQQTVTLDSSGNATWTFDTPFASTPAVGHMPQALDTNNPIICNYTARTPAYVSIHCWRTNVSGLLSALLGGNAAGAQVTLVARAA